MDRTADRVNLFVLGAQKAGSTALWRWLARQPEVCAPVKEPHFFDRPERYRDGNESALAAYHRPFAEEKRRAFRADCTPIYLYLPEVPARLARYNPDARLIVLLRHPAERAISHWAMEYKKGKETLPLTAALALEPLRRRGQTHRVYSYLHRGFYSRQLDRLLMHFPREQLLLLRSEQMHSDPDGTAAAVLDFLGLPGAPGTAISQAHTGDYRRPKPVIRRALARYFRPELRRLAQRYEVSWNPEATGPDG